VLLVGESAPAGGTHYYLANSGLFHAIRQAARRVYGHRTPAGEDFLTFAKGRGIWLVDLAAQPVNDLDEDARRSIVRRGIPRIAKVIADCAPAFVVATGTTYVAGPAAQALERSKVEAELAELPFPTAWHRKEFVEGLARVLRRARRRDRQVSLQDSAGDHKPAHLSAVVSRVGTDRETRSVMGSIGGETKSA
jgi:hypothetical protein